MNVEIATRRFLRSLVKMKGRLESDLTAVNSTLEKLGGDAAIPAPRQMSNSHRRAISKALRLRAKKAK